MVKLMNYLMTGVRVRDQPLGRTNPLQDQFKLFYFLRIYSFHWILVRLVKMIYYIKKKNIDRGIELQCAVLYGIFFVTAAIVFFPSSYLFLAKQDPMNSFQTLPRVIN